MSVKLHAAIAAGILTLVPTAITASAVAQSATSGMMLASSPPGPAGPRSGYINSDSVNVRSGPGTDRPVLYVAPRGTQMQILGQYGRGSDSWWRVRATSGSVPRSEGWVYGRFLTIGSTPPTVNYYDRGRQDGRADAQAGRTYDPVRGSRNLPANASREYTRGYADGYRPVNPNQGRPPVVDPTGPITPGSPRPPVVDPTGPITPGSPRPPVVDPTGPSQNRPPVTDPTRPVTPPNLTRPAIPGSPQPR